MYLLVLVLTVKGNELEATNEYKLAHHVFRLIANYEQQLTHHTPSALVINLPRDPEPVPVGGLVSLLLVDVAEVVGGFVDFRRLAM